MTKQKKDRLDAPIFTLSVWKSANGHYDVALMVGGAGWPLTHRLTTRKADAERVARRLSRLCRSSERPGVLHAIGAELTDSLRSLVSALPQRTEP